MVHFTQSRSCSLFYSRVRCIHLCIRVTPFGYQRLLRYVLLPVAFRSLSRPSSPYSSIGIRHEPIISWPYLHFRHFILLPLRYGFLYFFKRVPSLPSPSSLLSLFSKIFSHIPDSHLLVRYWDGIELNYRPPPYQSGALTN